MATVKESGVAVATFQTDYDDEVEFAARRWLIDRGRDRAAGHDAPFCLVASFIHPHDPYVAKPEFWALYDDADIDIPKALPPEKQDPFSRRVMDGIEASTVPLTDEEIIRARRAYLANVSYFDSKVGALVQALEDIGEIDNTLIVVTADHGDMLGERGLWYKMTFFEQSARVPLILAGPNVKTGVAAQACSLVDLLPTFIEAAGGDPEVLGEPVDEGGPVGGEDADQRRGGSPVGERSSCHRGPGPGGVKRRACRRVRASRGRRSVAVRMRRRA